MQQFIPFGKLPYKKVRTCPMFFNGVYFQVEMYLI